MQALIFDLDGTLLNTLADIAAACNKLLAEHGFPVHPTASYAIKVGNGFENLIRRSLPANAPISDNDLHSMISEAWTWYKEHMAEATEPYPGMISALDRLSSENVRLGVLSNKPNDMTVELIAHYFPETKFFHVQGALPEVPLKPNPASLLAIMQNYNLRPSETCYVGDSNVDVATAHNAAIRAVGASWGFRGRQELQEAGADYIVDYPSDLLRLGKRGLRIQNPY